MRLFWPFDHNGERPSLPMVVSVRRWKRFERSQTAGIVAFDRWRTRQSKDSTQEPGSPVYCVRWVPEGRWLPKTGWCGGICLIAPLIVKGLDQIGEGAARTSSERVQASSWWTKRHLAMARGGQRTTLVETNMQRGRNMEQMYAELQFDG